MNFGTDTQNKALAGRPKHAQMQIEPVPKRKN